MKLTALVIGLAGCGLLIILVKMVKASSYQETESDVAEKVRNCNNGQVYEEKEEGVEIPWD